MATERKLHRRAKERPSFVVSTLAEVAEFFGVGVPAINDWRGQADPMPGVNGHWDLSEIVRWKLGRGRQTSGLREELTAADIRLKTAQARAKELDNEIAAGELVERRNVELWLATACIEFREMVMALPEILCTSMPPDIRDFVREESDRQCRASLIALQRRLESMDEVERDQVPDTAGADKVG